MVAFTEIAERVWTARLDWYDVNVTVVAGQRGLVVVDTHGSTPAGRVLADAVRALHPGDLQAVVHTHWHFDHTFGTAGLLDRLGTGPEQVPVVAHETAAEELALHTPRLRSELAGSADERDRSAAETQVVAPTEVFSSVRVLDLGDRSVELLHPGRGHTGGDLVVRVPDVDVLLAGDLVEESGPPAYGSDCYPLDWPLTLDLLMQVMGEGTTVVPGHGAVVDLDFVTRQRGAVGQVAEIVRDLAHRGVPEAQALESAEWPYAPETLRHAVSRGYEQLPLSQRRLPLV